MTELKKNLNESDKIRNYTGHGKIKGLKNKPIWG